MRLLYFIFFLSSILGRGFSCLTDYNERSFSSYDRPERQQSFLSSTGHFMIHYDTTLCLSCTDSYNFVASLDYVEQVAIAADSARFLLINRMGYNSEIPDYDGVYDIFLFDYDPGVYGYNVAESNERILISESQCYLEGLSWNTLEESCYFDGANGASYIKIDKDFVGYDIDPINIMRLTIGHEYFHAIQRAYRPNYGTDDKKFLEMSSMWFEDIIEPNGNDYLSLGWISNLLDNPERNYNSNSNNGYELGLFGHYLSGFIDPNGFSDQKNSTILREMWERFSIYGNFSNQLEYIIKNSYNIDFHEVWNDFMTRNLFNGYSSDPNFEIYYHEDQALIDPISTNPNTITDSLIISFPYENNSVTIKSFSVDDGATIFLSGSSSDYIANIVTISNNSYSKELFLGSKDIYINDSHKMHFIISSSSSGSSYIDADVVFCAPSISNLKAVINRDNIKLEWTGVESDDISYQVWRDSELIGSTENIFYNDDSIIYDQTYSYFIISNNEVCSSENSESITVTAWPDPDTVEGSNFISIYPNPFYSSDDQLYLIIDIDTDCIAEIKMYDISGQLVISNSSTQLSNGRNRINFNLINLSSGIYFSIIEIDGYDPQIKKFSIIK